MADSTRSLLDRVPIFAGLKPEVLDDIHEHGRLVLMEQGDWIVQEGTPGSEMFIVETGAVEVVIHPGLAHETVVAVLRPGNFFGEMSLIECMPRAASVRSLEAGILLGLKAGELHHLFRLWPDQYAILILNIARDLSRRLRALDEKFSALSS